MQPLSSQLDLTDSPIGKLYHRHWLALLTAIHQHIFAREDAEDILLDVFLAALENEALLDMNASRQEAWLKRVAYNKCMDFYRHAKRHGVVALSDYLEPYHNQNDNEPEQTTLRQEELAQLRRRLASLSTLQQEILRLRFAEELPYAQIAARVRKNENTVRSILSRTLALLRNIYKKGGE